MNIEFRQQKHICTNTGNRTIGFYCPNAAALETLLESTATADEVKAEIRKWIEAMPQTTRRLTQMTMKATELP